MAGTVGPFEAAVPKTFSHSTPAFKLKKLSTYICCHNAGSEPVNIMGNTTANN
jgi:hypothetical protein